MRYVVDLHSHSGYAGGVGQISLENVAATMTAKGINAFGVGDCLQPDWRKALESRLEEKEPGLFALNDAAGRLRQARFVLQTEIIVTSPVPSGGRKITHVVITFPSFKAVDQAIALLQRWQVKIDIGRPFVKAEDSSDVAVKFFALAAIDPSILVFPAHVLMPQGVFGSDHPVDSMRDVFGDFTDAIRAAETGLSADPELLAIIPELDDKTLLSNSDCHSGALNRVGREFTALQLDSPSYAAIVEAIQQRKVAYTAEFNPAEGRYFLTGHKKGLEGHGQGYCYFSPDTVPADGKCPICGKKLTVGVLEQAMYLSRVQSPDGTARRIGATKAKQQVKSLVPLVEVLAAGMGVKNVSSKKITSLFEAVIGRVGAEAELWEMSSQEIAQELSPIVPENVLKAVLAVQSGDFSFQPGFDGTYGELVLGRHIGWFGHKKIVKE